MGGWCCGSGLNDLDLGAAAGAKGKHGGAEKFKLPHWLTSLMGDDFRDIERLYLRIRDRGRQFSCHQILHIAFSQADLFNRRQQVINISPSLRNFWELFLGNERFRAELVVFPGTTVRWTRERWLVWRLRAVEDLE